MTINLVYPDQYPDQLAAKASKITALMSPFSAPAVEVFESPPSHFRMRAEFKVWHADGAAHYAMYQPGQYKQPFVIEDFPVGSEAINRLMPLLLQAINRSSLLSKRLFQVEFLTTLSNQCVISLIYHRPLDENWRHEAEQLAAALDINIVGRSRKQKLVIGNDYVTETLKVGTQEYRYQQIETSFTQPNARVCEKMLSWAVAAAEGLGGDLLELYCGNGNFTLPLARHFERVLATEISKTSVNSALHNMTLNGVDNIQVVRMSSEEFTQAMDKQRAFRRLREIDLDAYNFSTIFVDPPRAGLDADTLAMVQRFPNILYVSCNPETLADNLAQLTDSHDIERLALFDQFPYTNHIESGVLLKRKTEAI
ncbi:tRNA (uridine(54)-C5)-methyltransferase TrmA [Pseudomaricurvus alcaniphilus]|uniref:tRNA (uridine(54)-C5)-methyltransferase TrmA n=1 Tax=Pseudomaricurvus alcaniphilus TaxID=1166482 RepID=UPI00140AC5E4|nr:tRNA (uridine(54)-C5)-methyltransferase TrmA [Pseudomaricurvus alcaniphilus]NHN39313.1 tRNA (uridine(54)-C5)-methyltransferase TrmA [Pseudomaricurvus alcaniphilus]